MSERFPGVQASITDISHLKDQIHQCRAKIHAAERKYLDARAELERVQSEQIMHIDSLLALAGGVLLNLGMGLEDLPKSRSFG